MEAEKQNVIAIVGPTASGKSTLAIELAKTFDGEVISADSRQVYRHLDIGTDKVMPENRGSIPHHCIDIAEPTERITAADFKNCGEKSMRRIVRNDHIPIIAGGTGFWLDVLLGRVTVPEVPPDPELRTELEQKTADELFAELQKHAPARAETIEPDNKRRLIRAHEIFNSLGYIPEPADAGESPYSVCWIGIDRSDEEYAERIPRRAAAWLANGFLAEIENLERMDISEDRWREFGFEYELGRQLLHGEITRDEFYARFLEKNRQYIKRQRKYFRRNTHIEWFHPDNTNEIKRKAQTFLEK